MSEYIESGADSGATAGKATGDGLGDLLWGNRSKWGKFGVLIIAILLLSAAASLVARLTVFKPVRLPFYHVALIAPISGANAGIGQSLRDGAQLYFDKVNAAGGVNGSLITLDVFDDDGNDANLRAIAETIARRDDVLAVIGPVSNAGIGQAAEVFDRTKVPMLVPTHTQTYPGARSWSFALGYDQRNETRFMANYVRNVSGDVLTSLIVDTADFAASATLFQETYERFGAPIRHRWEIDPVDGGLTNQLGQIVDEIKNANDAGTLYLAMNGSTAAQLVKLLRDSGVKNDIVGPSQLATQAFTQGFGIADYAKYTNGITTSLPLIFDTADEQAQQFRAQYLAAKGTVPDWVAAFGNESAHIISESIRALGLGQSSDAIASGRAQLHDHLASLRTTGIAIEGLSGPTIFDAAGNATKPIQIGVYDGQNLISALTQLHPIGANEVGNFIQLVRDGRALYVNDKFMYKTNVVYTGMLIKSIRNFDAAAKTFEMDFTVWFRYRGEFAPQDVMFDNAIEPIKLETPDRQEQEGELKYLSYSASGKFNADFLRSSTEYGLNMLGTSFRHRILDRNNLLYVVDVIGMGLVGEDNLTDKLRDSRALAPALGMVVENSWISQDIVRSEGLGSLTFVGSGKPQPDFSQILLGIITQTGAPSLRDFVPTEYLIYILIFAIVGAVFAKLMDRKRENDRIFWNAQSWMLRVICWPLMLFSLGALVLNVAFDQLEYYYVDMLVIAYRVLWWLVPTMLLVLAVKRFVWTPLERRSQRLVPGSVRAMTTLLIYMLAIFGVIANVFEQSITSLLATSGVAAMVLGLALQGNIANIFSGIVLNLERPFTVGDILQMADGTEAEVIDITWRSIRVRSKLGKVYSIPNSSATQSQMIRVTHSRGESYQYQQTILISPAHDPKLVTNLILEALDSLPGVAKSPVPLARFVGTGDRGHASYEMQFSVPEYANREVVLGDVWAETWQRLHAHGIEMSDTAHV